jgi:hypothetical protein
MKLDEGNPGTRHILVDDHKAVIGLEQTQHLAQRGFDRGQPRRRLVREALHEAFVENLVIDDRHLGGREDVVDRGWKSSQRGGVAQKTVGVAPDVRELLRSQKGIVGPAHFCFFCCRMKPR